MKILKLTVLSLVLCSFALSLRAQEANYSEWYLRRPDTQIYVRETGTGKDTVIVVHGGFGANHDYMIDSLKGLENKYRFVLFDQRGSLLSQTPREGLTFEKLVDDINALVKELNVGKVKLFCHSMGTLVCMNYVSRYPDTVSNVVLAGAVFSKSESQNDLFGERNTRQVKELENRESVQKLLKPLQDKLEKAGLKELNSYEDFQKSGLTSREATDRWRIKFASVNIFHVERFNSMRGGKAYYSGYAANMLVPTVNWKYDYRKALNDNGRTTLIQGDHDFIDFDAQEHFSQLKDYPKVEIKLIKNAGHNLWVDDALNFRKTLDAALQRK